MKRKQNTKETFDESDDNKEDWENDLEEEFKKGEENKNCIGRSAIVSRKEKKNLKAQM